MIEKECLKALDCLYDEDVFDEEVWGFVMEGDNLSCADVERAKKYYRDKIYNLIKEHFSPQPYKLEDLKVGMFVFDCIKNRVNKIIEIFEADVGIPYIKFDDGFGEWVIIEFEENRFYPVTKAMEYQE